MATVSNPIYEPLPAHRGALWGERGPGDDDPHLPDARQPSVRPGVVMDVNPTSHIERALT